VPGFAAINVVLAVLWLGTVVGLNRTRESREPAAV
jgi:hypothetical protein